MIYHISYIEYCISYIIFHSMAICIICIKYNSMILPGISDIIHNQYRVSLGICNRSDCQGDHPLEVSTQQINTDSEKLIQIYINQYT